MMQTLTLSESELQSMPVFGIAGNFADHLAQAGEDADFIQIVTEEKAAPKGIFPIYLPNFNNFLATYPLSDSTIEADFSQPINCHLEPEVCVLFDITYEANQVSHLQPKAFSAFNDCSIRRPNAPKISHKKNWGANCAGVSKTWVALDSLAENSTLDDYHIVSYLKRAGETLQYGMDSPVKSYQYFHQKLLNWITHTLNHQTDQGPLEPLHAYLTQLNQPSKIIITLGATRYTDFGQTGFLQPQDEIAVYVYHQQKCEVADILAHFKSGKTDFQAGSLLRQIIKQTPTQSPIKTEQS